MDKKRGIKNQEQTKHDLEKLCGLPLQGLMAILEATKGEYEYLQKAREGLHTRVGILIALLTALVSVAFIKDVPNFITLFKNNIIIAHFRVICLTVLFISFFIALIYYVRVFLARNYYAFSYHTFVDVPIETIRESRDEQLIMLIYREYAKCIEFNQKVFDKTVSLYNVGNKWLIVTMALTIVSIIISLI